MKTSKSPKGRDKLFAAGGKQHMFGAGDRTKTKYPASLQKPNRTGQHDGKPAPHPRTKSGDQPGRAPINFAGDMGGSAGAAKPRRPAA
jgi:hypothetical protein